MKGLVRVSDFSKLLALTVLTFPLLTFAADGETANSAPTSVAQLAASVNFKEIITAILAIAGTVVALYATVKGAQFIIRQVRGA